MFRTIFAFLVIGLAAATNVESQQVLAPRFAQQPSAQLTIAPSASPSTPLASLRPTTQSVDAKSLESEAVREVSARNVLAIIGAIVVVGALIALAL